MCGDICYKYLKLGGTSLVFSIMTYESLDLHSCILNYNAKYGTYSIKVSLKSEFYRPSLNPGLVHWK